MLSKCLKCQKKCRHNNLICPDGWWLDEVSRGYLCPDCYAKFIKHIEKFYE